MTRSILGLDVGGANLKAAHPHSGQARSVPFALWKQPGNLPATLRELIRSFNGVEELAVTMTGELCDCFESKRQGIAAILDAVTEAAGTLPVRVWRNDGRFVDPAQARASPRQTAAANWLALATFAARTVPTGPVLLIDIGSTTTDIVPLHNGQPIPRGRSDPERLRSAELLYTGVRRTPVCALRGGQEVAAELFATTLDVYLILEMIADDPHDCNTADGRPATRAAAHARMARMLCADLETSTEKQRRELAHLIFLQQLVMLEFALKKVTSYLPCLPRILVLAGEGEFLARCALRHQTAIPACDLVSLNYNLTPEISRAACAYAVAELAADEKG